MKSRTYNGADAQDPPQDPDDVEETIVLEGPHILEECAREIGRITGDLTSEVVFEVLRELLLTPIRAKVRPAAGFLWLYYLTVCTEGGEVEVSLRDAAQKMNLAVNTVKQGKAELVDKGLLAVVAAGHGGRPERLQVKVLYQNLIQASFVSNFDTRVVSRMCMIDGAGVGPSSKESKYFHKNVQSSLDGAFGPSTFNCNPSRLNVEFPPRDGPQSENSDDLEDAFSSLKSPARPTWRRFQLKPPPGPDESPPSPRKRRPRNPKILKGPDRIPWYVHKLMYKLCYGITTDKQAKTLTKEMAGRVGSVLLRLQAAGADVAADIYRFGEWWATWAKFRPTPEKVQEFWWRAIDELDHTHREVKDLSDERARRRAEELKLSVRSLETAMRRQRGEGIMYEGWTDEQIHEEARRRAEGYANRPN